MTKQEKVFFVQKNNEGEFETESLWCTKAGDFYKIDNIPFIAKRISLGDIIKTEYDNDEKINYFDDFVSISGNTTVRLFFNEANLIENTRQTLESLGCDSEVLLQKKIVAVNIPKEVNYKPIKDFLEEGEAKNKWKYEESCLVHKY